MKRRHHISSIVVLTMMTLWLTMAHASQNFVVVSDLDDTIKITNVQDADEAAWNALFGKKAFAGMSRLYQTWTPSSGLIVLSGAPGQLESRVENFFRHNKFRPAALFLNECVACENTNEFKKRKLQEIVSETEMPLILVGDDTQYDPEVYSEVASANSDKVAAIYIRHVTGVSLVEGIKVFFTPFDIAVHELWAGRLSEEQVLAIGRTIVEGDASYIRPHFVFCPREIEKLTPVPPEGYPAIENMRLRVIKRIKNLCRVKVPLE